MCGINGLILKNLGHKECEKESLIAMNELITHRGPDDDGFYHFNDNGFYLGMAMRRLAIIDLNSGKQPIYNDDESIVIVFNGEIYNYKTLKINLENEGIIFKTKSDTEVILRLYEAYGIKSFSKLDGMFAFSIHDKNLNRLFIARDFFGEKPLYYTKYNDSFIWASELKSIIKILPSKPSINAEGLNLFLQLTYIPAPYSIYENIHKLEANHYLEFDCINFSYEIHEIEQKFKTYSETTKAKATKTTHDLVSKSVVSRSISDVPLGTFLSGGVDSSIISMSLAQQSSIYYFRKRFNT
jgi:asparagine synthase (glutamine-hydrolysing)